MPPGPPPYVSARIPDCGDGTRGEGHQLEVEHEKVAGGGTGLHPAKPALELESAEEIVGGPG